MTRVLRFYENANGRSQVREFISDQPRRQRAMIEVQLRNFRDETYPLARPHSAYLRDGISELRIHADRMQYRFLYAHLEEQAYLLLSGFVKKQSAVPREEIEAARERLAEWRTRMSKP